MARRKSLVAQLYAARQKAKRDRERAHKEFMAEQRKLAAQMAREEGQRQREQQRADRSSPRGPVNG